MRFWHGRRSGSGVCVGGACVGAAFVGVGVGVGVGAGVAGTVLAVGWNRMSGIVWQWATMWAHGSCLVNEERATQ